METLPATWSDNKDGFSLDLQNKTVTLWGRPVTVPFPVDGVTYAKEE